MSPALYTFGFLLLVFTRKVRSVSFQQSSSQVLEEGTEELKINCSHDDSSLQVMLWYQHKQSSRSMSLIGFTVLLGDPSYEDQFKGRFQIKRDDTLRGSLIIRTLNLSDSAVYFCAASSSQSEAYFGAGTKLTVLEVGVQITPPTVKVLPPSPKECRNQKDKLKKKTIVCVASEFYPDHVSVFWQINGVNVSEGVATDNAALRNGKKYTITSRLRVPAKEWYTPGNEFTCIVSFYNGTHTEYKQSSISGDEAPAEENIMTRENYLKITQKAKLSYGVFIVKSCLYGVFVAFLVWKLQGSTGKRNNRAKLT